MGLARARSALGLAVCATVAMLAPGASGVGWAAGAKKPAANPAAEEGASAEKAYAAGLKAYEAGKADQAVAQLTTAINGGLGALSMARALYTRGLAYRKTGQSALAIADLSNALWLKTGLSGEEIARAQEARSTAYNEAGLSTPSVSPRSTGKSLAQAEPLPPKPVAPVAKAPAPPPPPPRTAAVAERVVPQRDAAKAPVLSGWNPATKPTANGRAAAPVEPVAPVPPRTSAATAPARATVSAPLPIPREVASLPQRPAAPVSAPATSVATSVAQDPTSSPSSSGGLGGFFTGLFGDMSLGPPAPPPPQVASRAPSVSEWSDQTSIASSGAREAIAASPPPSTSRGKTKTAAVASAPVAPKAKPDKAEGKYQLFVASAKSRQEAIRIATKLKTQHRRAISSQQIAIEPQSGEGEKAAYSVKLGPFASANEPRNLCVKLRQTGYDCKLLTP